MRRIRQGAGAAVAAILLVLLVAGWAHAAYAEPPPTATPSSTPTSASTPAPGPAPANPVPTEPATTRPPASDGQGVLGPLTATDPDGVPLDHYDITADEGAWNNWGRKLLLWLTDGTFALVRVVIGLVAWLLNWAFEFGPAKTAIGPARQIAQAYQTQVVDRLGLPAFFLTLAAAWCGVMFMRGRKSRGAGELAITLLISALAATVLARPADLLLGDHGLLGQTRDTSMAIASITATGGRSDNADPRQASKPLTDTLIKTFVIQPHQMLNYGTVLDTPGRPDKCLDTYKKIVKDGPWGGDDEPRNRMTSAGCKSLADYNHDPTWDRLLGAVLLLIAALLVAALILVMVGILLTAISALAFYAMTGQAAAVIALLPGGGRALLWRWVGGILKVVMVVFAVVVFVPLLSVFMGALVASTADQPLIVRFFLIDVVSAAGLLYHRKLVTFGTRAGYRIARRMEYARIGGSRGSGYGGMGGDGYGGGYGGYGGFGMGMGWLGGGNPSGLSPVSLGGIMRGARSEINRVTDPVTSTARTAKGTWVGPAAATAKARRKLPADASDLRARMYNTRAGRVTWRTGKTVTTAGKVGFEYTLGLPVTLERDYTNAKQAADNARQAAGRAGENLVERGRTARDYGAHWARNSGMHAAARVTRDHVVPAAGTAAGAFGDQAKFILGPTVDAGKDAARKGAQATKDSLQNKIDAAKLPHTFDPQAARRYLDQRAAAVGTTHRIQAQPTAADRFKGGAVEGAQKGARKGTDPKALAKELRKRMEKNQRRNPPPSTPA